MKNKTIYLYPRCEDSQICAVVLTLLKQKGMIKDFSFIDDSKDETSLANNLHKVQNGELWIVHQDIQIRNVLLDNARSLSCETRNGILELESILFNILKSLECDFNDEVFVQWLNYMAYFALFCSLELRGSALMLELERLGTKFSKIYSETYKIPFKSIGVYADRGSINKHLGSIVEILEKNGLSLYFYGDKDLNLWNFGFFTSFLEIFGVVVNILMPLTNFCYSGTKHIYIPHAYIDPIASLVQRNRPLDDFWFKKKFGINGYRIVPSYSNYLIYKDKAKELGYEDEIVCGGYPSLDTNLKEYEKVKCEDGNNVLIAFNNKENLNVIKKLIEVVLEKNKQKIIFRPYVSWSEDFDILSLKNTFENNQNFIYDDSPKLTAEMMKSCCVLIGDWSSLVWTFPFTALKPAILLFQDKKILENSYNGVKFYNPIIHLIASNVDELLSCIKESQKNTKKRAKEIFEFRKKEVFNLGHSSEFIADFIIKKFNELK